MAMALFGVAVVIGPAFGPTLGGYIVDNYSWEWIFYINLPVGPLALFMVSRFVHEPEDIRIANQARRTSSASRWTGSASCSGARRGQPAVRAGGGQPPRLVRLALDRGAGCVLRRRADGVHHPRAQRARACR
jgi:MFS family permease